MPSERRVHTTMPAQDLERARGFYEQTLGFEPRTVTAAGVFYRASMPRSPISSGAAWSSRATTSRGFERETSIAQAGPNRTAWFKDSEGNLIGLIEFGDAS